LPQLSERSARQVAQRVLRHDPEASTAAKSLRSGDRRSMSPWRVPPGVTRADFGKRSVSRSADERR